MLLRGWSPAAQRMVPSCSEMVPCSSEDGPLLLRGWSHAAQRTVPCCSEDGPMLLRGRSHAAQRTVPCCSEDGPLLLRGWSPATQRWSPAAQRMVPCYSEDGPLLLRGWSPGWSPSQTIKCDNAAVRCSGALYTDCSRDIKDGDYEEHECVPTLTPEEEKQAAGLLKRAISTSPDKAIIQLATCTGEAVK